MSSQPASPSHLRLYSTPSANEHPATAARPPVADGGSDRGRPDAERSPTTAAAAPASDVAAVKRVEVALGEIAPLLADAIDRQLGWLHDFSSDTVSIDADLYEVLLAYQQMRRQSAA